MLVKIFKEALRVLVVDNDVKVAKYHASLLENAGFITRITNLPSEALELIPSFDPDLIVLDYHLPEMKGPDLVACIQEFEDGYLVGVLLLTADQQKEIVMQALSKGVTSFLLKPVDQAVFPVHCLAIAENARRVREKEKQIKTTFAEQRFLEQVLNKHAIVSMTDKGGNITYVNDKFCEISGYGKEELVGKNHRLLKSGKHSPEYYSELWKTISSGKTWQGEICNRRKDGSFYWVESTIMPFIDVNGKPYKYVSIRTDITHIKNLVDQVSLQSNVLSVTMDGVLITDAKQADLPIIYANPAFSLMSGYPLEEILGKNCRFLNAGDSEQEGIDQMRSAIAYVEEIQVVVRNYRKDGSMFWNEIHLSPVFNSENELTHFVATSQNVTARIESEKALKNAKEEAERANQAKSMFLSSMSHELRTPMNAILGFGQLMDLDSDLSEMNQDSVKEILKAGHHLLDLIDDVLDLAKIESGKLLFSIEPVEVLPVIDECINLVKDLAEKRNVTIDHEGFSGAVVRADRVRFKQSLVNLMSNAIKYNRKGGSVKLVASAVVMEWTPTSPNGI